MEESASADIKTLEFNFRQALEEPNMDCRRLVAELDRIRSVKSYSAGLLAGEMQEKLIASKNIDGLVLLLEKKALWNGDAPAFGQPVPMLLRQVSQDRAFLRLVDNSKFGIVKPSESFRRLAVLRSLAEGATFFDKTWGLGEVKKVDGFNSRVYIDFPGKPAHSMSFEYAAEALRTVPESHLLAVARNNPGAIAAMLKDDPASLVKCAIASFGPSTVSRLQNLFDSYGIIKSDDWKKFWSRARKPLSDDPLVDVPQKRSDPISLRQSAIRYDDEWFGNLRKERSIPAIFNALSVYEKESSKGEMSDFAREVVTDRLMFAINGAFLFPPPMFTRLVLMAQRLDVTTPKDELVEILLEDERFLVAGDKLSTGEAGEMITFIVNTRPEAVELLLEHLPQMNYSLLKQTMAVLRGNEGFLPMLQERTRELLFSTSSPAPLLVWTLKDNDWEDLRPWKLPSLYELMEHAIAVCEDQAAAGELLHMQHYVKDLYGKIDGWFAVSFASLTALQQEALFMRLQSNSFVVEIANQRKLVDKMIEINPSLAGKKQTNRPKAAAPEIHYTSWHSLKDRRDAFRHLVEVEIPQNTRDIEFARGYGDLRENFEYQSAKDQQRILLARREEWSLALEKIRGFSFDGVADYSSVSMGTEVTLLYADGSEKAYSILGEWDNDEELGIISCLSRLAKILIGAKAGDSVSIPAVSGEETVTVKAIGPISAKVREWIGQPAAEGI